MTIRALALALGFPSHSYVSEIETGKKIPSTEMIIKLAELFQVSVDQLVHDEREIDNSAGTIHATQLTTPVMDKATPPSRSWQVLLLGGAAGTGKTSVSYRLARYFDIGITEVDDFQVILECMTTPEQQPVLHWWRTHPGAGELAAEEIVEHTIAVGRVMAPALTAVIANHLETQMSIVLEGDFILPALVTQPDFVGMVNDGNVRALFLYESDLAQIVANFLLREPEHGPQHKRAEVSWLYGQWLKAEAERYNIPALPARPWDTLFDRVLAAVR
jgi:2-phosphoglycerate kinase